MPVQSENQICFVLPQFIKHLLCTVFCYLHFYFRILMMKTQKIIFKISAADRTGHRQPDLAFNAFSRIQRIKHFRLCIQNVSSLLQN